MVNYETANSPYRHLKSVQVSLCKHVYECVIECITDLRYKWHVANIDAPLTKHETFTSVYKILSIIIVESQWH